MTKTIKERLISTAFSIGLLFIGGLFTHFFWQKETNTTKLNQDIENLKIGKADKIELKELREQNNAMHLNDKKDIKEYFDTRFQDLKEFMIELNKKR